MSPIDKMAKFSFAQYLWNQLFPRGNFTSLQKYGFVINCRSIHCLEASKQIMYTIISGTNRADSYTIKVSKEYQRLLKLKGMDASIVSLEGLEVGERNEAFEKIEEDKLIPVLKFIFISPEYNGSIPGVLKSFFDISDVRKAWTGKKALLTGVSTGRAGNLRGMEHLTGILHYLRVVVHPNKLPISVVDRLFDDLGRIRDQATLSSINEQLDEFIAF
jgi:chromate reductase, NAD(P)H dehydrogenase (quinone)